MLGREITRLGEVGTHLASSHSSQGAWQPLPVVAHRAACVQATRCSKEFTCSDAVSNDMDMARRACLDGRDRTAERSPPNHYSFALRDSFNSALILSTQSNHGYCPLVHVPLWERQIALRVVFAATHNTRFRPISARPKVFPPFWMFTSRRVLV